MKRIYLSALIVIALALSVASPSPCQTNKRHSAAKHHHTTASPILTQSNQPSSVPTAATVNNYTYSYYYPIPVAQSPPVWFQICTTIILLAFTLGLWRTAIWQWRAIKDQADISRRALTELEIPIVSIGKIIPHVLWGPGEYKGGQTGPRLYATAWFEYTFKNSGRSFAEITTVHGELRVLSVLPMPPDYSGSVEESAFPIGPNSDTGDVRWSATHKFTGNLDDEWDLLSSDKAMLVCFGYVRYRDAFKTRWISGFGWRWNPNNNGAYLIGGRYYNYNRKDEPYTGLSEPE